MHEYVELLQVSVTVLILWKPQAAFKAHSCLSASVHLDFAWPFLEGFEGALSLCCVMHVQ